MVTAREGTAPDAPRLAGASVHLDQPGGGTPDAVQCWFEALADRVAALRATLAQGAPAGTADLRALPLRIRFAELAHELVLSENAALERVSERIEDYDRESEGVLAETGGRVRRARAALAHRRDNPAARGGLPTTADDLAELERELASAEAADGHALSERSAGHELLRAEWRAHAHGALAAAVQFLQLTEGMSMDAYVIHGLVPRAALAAMRRDPDSNPLTT